jgi:hypothetical protein
MISKVNENAFSVLDQVWATTKAPNPPDEPSNATTNLPIKACFEILKVSNPQGRFRLKQSGRWHLQKLSSHLLLVQKTG